MNLNCCLGQDPVVYQRETRPAIMVETKDESGKVVSVTQSHPAIIHRVTMLPEEPAAKPIGIFPILAAVGAAFFLAKG